MFTRGRFGLLILGLFITQTVGYAEQLPLKSYTRANGLIHERIQRVVQDSRGFLWFCTALGLSRFDGYRFTNYRFEQATASSLTNDMLEARNGVRWVASNGRGVFRLNLQAIHGPAGQYSASADGTAALFEHYPVGDDPASNRVNRLYEDHAGQIWAGTDAGLFRLVEDEHGAQFARVALNVPGQPDRLVQVWDFVEDLEGCLWIATKFGLVRRLPDQRMIHFWVQSPGGRDLVSALIRDRDGRLWACHQSMGLVVFKPLPLSSAGAAEAPPAKGRPWRALSVNATEHRAGQAPLPDEPGEALLFTTADGLGSNEVRALIERRDGRIWAGTRKGLSVLEGARFRNYTVAEGLSGDLIASLEEDHDGNLWIASATAGAMRLARGGLVIYLAKDGLGGETANSIFENREGQLYVVCSEGYINRIDEGRIIAVRPNMVNGSQSDLRDALEDREGDWWLATIHGIYRFAKPQTIEQLATAKPKAFYTVKDGLADSDVRRIYEDALGDIWFNSFTSANHVLTRWERATGKFHRYSERDGLRPFRSAWTFCEDRSGALWIGFRDGPLARYAGGRFTILTEEDGLPEGAIVDLHLDGEGRLWIAASRGGVGLIEDPGLERPHIIKYTTAQGLISNSIFSIVEDAEGNIYFNTIEGLDRLDRATNLIKHYRLDDGSIYTSASAFRDRRGAIWFAAQRGVARLEPEPEGAQSTPPVFIGGLRIAGLPQPISELGERAITGLELRPDQNHVQIDFFGMSFAQGEALRFQFMIEGVDRDWSIPTDQRSVNLSLGPGSYRFLVRAVGSDGATNSAPASVAFKILPPLWRRWWFITAALVVMAIPAVSFARYRAARLKALRESENRFRALAETASDAIFAIDEHGKVILINPAAESVFGYRREEVLGHDISRLIPGYMRSLRLAGFGDDSAAEISWDAREVKGIYKSGVEIPLELSFGEFTRDDKRYFTIIARDVSERKRAEEALRKVREERLTELEQVRRRIAADLHDDIGSSLSQISLLSEVARRGAHDAPQASEALYRISTASHELLNSMSDIVWAINPHKDHLSDLIHRMRRFAGETLNARNIPFQFRAPDADCDLRLGANIRREVFLIFKESVNNIARHSGCSRARIEFSIESEHLKLRVSDNGEGFDVAIGSDGHGLTSMRARAVGIGGRFDLSSVIGMGTIVTVLIPLGHQPGPS